jgi:hypothetical protein
MTKRQTVRVIGALLRALTPTRAAITLALAALVFAAPVFARCGSTAYSYTGLQSLTAVRGVRATIVSLATPRVRRGHVAGWVGVSSPNGQEWIQIGVSAFPGDRMSHIYVEIAQPNRDPIYQTVRSTLPTHQHHRFAVVELADRPGWWQAWLDGSTVSPAVFLAGSHGGWHAQATAESWNDNSGACNAYTYSFDDVEVAAAPDGAWKRMGHANTFQGAGYRLARRSRSAFIAASVVRPVARATATSSPARVHR